MLDAQIVLIQQFLHVKNAHSFDMTGCVHFVRKFKDCIPLGAYVLVYAEMVSLVTIRGSNVTMETILAVMGTHNLLYNIDAHQVVKSNRIIYAFHFNHS